MIKLRRKGYGGGIQFSENVAPACLPTHDSPQKAGTECFVSGWGKTNVEGTQDTDCLQSTMVPLIGHQDCRNMYSKINRAINNGEKLAIFNHFWKELFIVDAAERSVYTHRATF